VPRIRPVRPGDEPALAEICLRTADSGADATGLLPDDDLWANMFVLPYAARHPEVGFVVERDDGVPAGYIVCAPDTDAFEEWFRDEWWPRFAERWPRPDLAPGAPSPATPGDDAASGPARAADPDDARRAREDDLLDDAYERGDRPSRYQADGYPAHLHIDLLPELQGQGWGRRLIGALVDRLRADGVAGLHLVAGAANTGAVAFYPRVGFEPLPGPDSVRAFGMRL
jgi:ribosomal protein S18 acetylase RimI-like enzyme